MDANKIKKQILEDMKVRLSEEFDRNFTRKAFFSNKWKPRKQYRSKRPMRGSLLLVSGRLRRSIKATVTSKGLEFRSDTPYAAMHNEGFNGSVTIKAHSRRVAKTGKYYRVRSYTKSMTMPERRFIGDAPNVREMIKEIISYNMKEFQKEMERKLKER